MLDINPRTIMSTAIALTLAAAPVLAQDDEATNEPPAQPCTGPEYSQFDFWLGHWQVTANGQLAGHNRIEKTHNGCVITEHWDSTSPFSGESINMYDAARERWHQTWGDSSGTLLLLDGGIVDGAMVLSGQQPGADGVLVDQRIVWTPSEDGSVRQLWQQRDGDGEWQTLFDGLYEKVTDSAD